MTLFTIGKLARASDVRVDTIRYYERQGLVLPEARSESGYRLYGQESLRRVKFIRKAQSLGFSLTEIAQLLHFGVDQDATKADVFGLTMQKIAAHQAKIRELEALHRILVQVAKRCAADASPVSDCPILSYLYPDEAVPLANIRLGKQADD